jgi:glutamine synthetase type III
MSVFQMEESEIHLARGYTAWDPSPAFILERLLHTYVFISYTGEALDYKHHFCVLMVMDEAALSL